MPTHRGPLRPRSEERTPTRDTSEMLPDGHFIYQNQFIMNRRVKERARAREFAAIQPEPDVQPVESILPLVENNETSRYRLHPFLPTKKMLRLALKEIKQRARAKLYNKTIERVLCNRILSNSDIPGTNEASTTLREARTTLDDTCYHDANTTSLDETVIQPQAAKSPKRFNSDGKLLGKCPSCMAYFEASRGLAIHRKACLRQLARARLIEKARLVMGGGGVVADE